MHTSKRTDPVKILVVDDHDEFRVELIRYLRQQEGIEIAGEAKNGFEAITLSELIRPEIVFMDISMPIMSGLQAAVHIKKLLPGTKIIIVTIHEEQTYQTLASAAGTDGFICKSNVKQDISNLLKQFRN